MRITIKPLALVVLAIAASLAAPAMAQSRAPFGGSQATAGRPDAGTQPSLTISAQASTASVAPGDTLVIAVILDHREGWHTNLNKPVVPPEMEGFIPVPTTIAINLPEGTTLTQGPVQWPESYAAQVDFLMTGEPISYLVYHGRAIAYVPLRVSDSAEPGTAVEIPVTISYQACDDRVCLPPTSETLKVAVEVVALGSATPPATDGDFAGFIPAVFENPALWGTPDQATAATAGSEPDDAQATASEASGSLLGLKLGNSLIFLAIGSFIGGMILNLTPCVLPVIPIKVLTLTQHAGEHRGKTLTLGIAMAAGVVAFWLAMGIPTALLTSFADPSRLFGYWFVTIPMGVVIVLLAFGLMGMFTLSLPQTAYRFNPKADNVSGSFGFGVMTGVLGLPCFGLAAGGIIPIAASMGQLATIVIFTMIGVGMAAPYLVLAAFPKLLSRVPKTGPGSELVKQVLGLLLAGFGVFYFGTGIRALVKAYPYTADVLHLYGLAALAAAAGLWLVYQTFRITKSPAKRGVFGLVGLGLVLATLYAVVGSTTKHRGEYFEREEAMAAAQLEQPVIVLKTVWNEYTPALLAAIEERGMVAFIDFTADWCINCKVFEAQVLNREPTRALLREDDVAMVKVDLTGSNPDGNKLLADLGRVGIPAWAVVGPGVDAPIIINAYNAGEVARAIKAARGEPMASGD
ncbi:MAG: thiol:disulfide interchange protein [Phycisphaerales bacterium]|jgi:thiol:disulfide interchange protein